MTKISNFGKQNSTLGSVVPLAMFLSITYPRYLLIFSLSLLVITTLCDVPSPASADTSPPPHSFQERIHLSTKNLNPLNHSSHFLETLMRMTMLVIKNCVEVSKWIQTGQYLYCWQTSPTTHKKDQ